MKFLSAYSPMMPYKIVYMMQQHEYDYRKFWLWLITIPDLTKTIKRGKLVITNKVRLMLSIAYVLYVVSLAIVVGMFVMSNYMAAIVGLLVLPVLVIVPLLVLLLVGNTILKLKRRTLMRIASEKFKAHQGVRIAVLGSYGKTSMKEMLTAVLRQKFVVAMTPGNKNVAISHARWAMTLSGDEDVLVIEYGEGEPGDIKKLAGLSHPTMAIITGVAPNHLDQYKTLNALEEDLASIGEFVPGEVLYINADASSVVLRLDHKARLYSNKAINGWNIVHADVKITGTLFTMKRGSVTMKLHSRLLGEHNIGPLAAVASIAYDLGMSASEIEAGVAEIMPFEHRMQARQIHGAWLIDDTYNGNLEGLKAGLKLLTKLEAKRKIYVTPGLVDQGDESKRVHYEIGRVIAFTNPDRVVLMQNRNTDFIKQGMDEGGFTGELIIEIDPLSFYTNIEQFLAAGDLVLMQNDLPDAYA